ncbi:MAG: hypothetical protein P0116_17100 [Candidatus Nitrosocosmicus sp.]|nr:hypothetical protein [Candidatus Nitrosocosmicus sp.]
MKIIFTDAPSNNYSFIDHDDDEIMNKMPSNGSLNLFGKSIIVRNMSIINSLYGIDSVVIPKKMSFLKSIIQTEFKSMPIIEADEENSKSDWNLNDTIEDNTGSMIKKNKIKRHPIANLNILSSSCSFTSSEIATTSITNSRRTDPDFSKSQYSQITPVCNKELISMNPYNTIVGTNSTKSTLESFNFQHPWEFLDITQELLKFEIKATTISNKATVAKTAIIEGPCSYR